MLKAVKTQAETYIGDNIEYDVKSFQVKATIVKRTKIWEKGLTVNRSQKTVGMANEYVTQWTKSYKKLKHVHFSTIILAKLVIQEGNKDRKSKTRLVKSLFNTGASESIYHQSQTRQTVSQEDQTRTQSTWGS